MHDELLDKDKTLDLAHSVSMSPPRAVLRTRRSWDPRVWLGALVLNRSAAAERDTPRGGRTAKDRKSYIPRDAALSLLQARGDQYPDALTSTGTAFAESGNWRQGFDYHFVTEFLSELTMHLIHRVLFRLPPGGPRIAPLGPDARLILVSDWGTGEGVALAVADQMRRQIDAAGEREVHVVHLGDVYYAGTRWEARHRFLDHWPVRVDEVARVRSWCLNGNHDMYAAGEGLFDVIVKDDRFARQRTEQGQPTSEFHLRNDHWDVLALDTSWKFHLGDVRGGGGHLEGRQRRWIGDRLDGSTRRTMLLTHHQPFTRVGPGPGGVKDIGNLVAATATWRQGRGVDAWFWGHEHRLFAYGARAGIGYATCMGHGAVLEEPAESDVAASGEAEFRATFRDEDGDEWRMPGFTVVDLDDRVATVTYLDMHGHPWRAPDVLRPS